MQHQEPRALDTVVDKFNTSTDDPENRFGCMSIICYALWRCCIDGYYRSHVELCDDINDSELFFVLADQITEV